jgi:hypothetical protein
MMFCGRLGSCPLCKEISAGQLSMVRRMTCCPWHGWLALHPTLSVVESAGAAERRGPAAVGWEGASTVHVLAQCGAATAAMCCSWECFRTEVWSPRSRPAGGLCLQGKTKNIAGMGCLQQARICRQTAGPTASLPHQVPDCGGLRASLSLLQLHASRYMEAEFPAAGHYRACQGPMGVLRLCAAGRTSLLREEALAFDLLGCGAWTVGAMRQWRAMLSSRSFWQRRDDASHGCWGNCRATRQVLSHPAVVKWQAV